MNMTLTVSTWNFKHLGGEYASPARVIEKIHSLGYGTELWLNWDAEPEFYDRGNWDKLRELVGVSTTLSRRCGRSSPPRERGSRPSGMPSAIEPVCLRFARSSTTTRCGTGRE